MSVLPLTELVGLEPATHALLLLAIEPRLGGAVFAAPAGTGKSSLARGFANLGFRVQGSGHRSDQQYPEPYTLNPFVELPPAADEEALLGGIDLEATLRSGLRVARAGLLARAHGGTLYADQLNLLSDAAVNLLLGALDAGEVKIEREGLSFRAPATFSLLGSYDPAEGQPRRHLLDRVGLWMSLPAQTDALVRQAVVRANEDGRRKTADERRVLEIARLRADATTAEALLSSSVFRLPSDQADSLNILQNLVAAAHAALPDVTISDQQIGQLAATALAFGVEGHRADGFAVYAACAAAALALRDAVEPEDLELALRLVILPRATHMPENQEPQSQEPQSEEPQSQEPQNQEPQNQEPQNQEPRTENQESRTDPETEDGETQNSELNTQNVPAEQVLAALLTELPAELTTLPFKALRRGKTGSRGTVAGTRGRHIRSVAGDARRGKIDVPATLRAAAPWQSLRGQGAGGRGQRQEDKTIRRQDDKTAVERDRLPISPSSRLRISPSSRLYLRAEDIRVKQFKSKAGALFLFAVDASGSMALHRMRQAKGAVHALLQRAYVHRDRVALLAFRGESAELLLPPSQSVELARRALDLLPTGGGTPIAAALLAALDVAKQARGRGIMQTVLVLLTDGRANVGLVNRGQEPEVRGQAGAKATVSEELRVLGQQVAEAGIHALVVDTQRSYLSRGEAHKLAEYLGGEYIYLPNANGEAIADAAAGGVAR